jgi:peptide deformylase
MSKPASGSASRPEGRAYSSERSLGIEGKTLEPTSKAKSRFGQQPLKPLFDGCNIELWLNALEVTMSEIMKIYTYPEPVLRGTAEYVENIDEDTQKLIECMAETMYAAPGIGLAANQVGKLQRILIYDLTPKDKGRNLSVLINPEIVESEGSIVWDEACLSVVDFSAEVTRHGHVKVRGYDRHGKPVHVEAEGLLAVCLQHEIDHLDGKLFIDHISSLKRALYKKRIKKMLKKSKEDSTPRKI